MTTSTRSNEKGIALFFALMFIFILSVLGVSIMFISQLETWSSLNYREMIQARYGAEAGLNSAANYIVNTYCAAGNSTCTNGNAPASGDTISLYNTNVSPVTLASNGNPVVLSTTSSASNYPVSSVETAFQSAVAGNLTSGNTKVNYTATATLVAMNQVTTASGPATVQTWSVTANGAIAGIRSASEQVTGIVEQQVTFAAVPTPSYGVFGTGNHCGSLTFSGGVVIASYDSKHPNFSGGNLVPDAYGGDIGSNGNLNESGGATVDGTMSTPRTGVGPCSSGGVDAWSDSGQATVTGCNAAPPAPCVNGGVVALSQAAIFTTPALPNPLPPTTSVQITKNSTCGSLGISGCSGSAGNLILAPGSYGDISLSGGAQVTFAPGGNYAINSITVSGNSTISPGATNASPVIINIAGQNQTSPLNFSGQAITNANSSGVPTPLNMQFVYAGTGTLNLSGGSQSAATVYAPNAPISLSGGSVWYGSIVASTINDSGGVSVYYDRELNGSSGSTPIATVQNFMMDSFSWSRF